MTGRDHLPTVEEVLSMRPTSHLLPGMPVESGAKDSITYVGPYLLDALSENRLAARSVWPRIPQLLQSTRNLVAYDPRDQLPSHPSGHPDQLSGDARRVWEDARRRYLEARDEHADWILQELNRKTRQLFEMNALLHYKLRGFLGCFAMVARAARRLHAATNHDGIKIDGLTEVLVDYHAKDTGLKYSDKASPGTIGWYVKGRDWLEHRDKRLPQADTEAKREFPFRYRGDLANVKGAYHTRGGNGFTWLFWNLDGDTLRMGKTRWVLGDTALQLLDRFVEDVDRVVCSYAIQRYREDGNMLAR